MRQIYTLTNTFLTSFSTLTILLSLLSNSQVFGTEQFSAYEVCRKWETEWKTDYAPDDPTDVNYNNYRAVSTGMIANPNNCQSGSIVESPFMDDALRRLNFYRWLAGLEASEIDQVNQVRSQECALMMAMNLNGKSPWYTPSSDPHTDQTNWKCASTNAKFAAPVSNIYAGQSLPGVSFSWQTTPAYILSGFVDDYSSDKSGHRQNILCPNLDGVSFGHVCYYESTTSRYFCGGCQWAYGRNGNPMPPSGYIAWPPAGPVPAGLVNYNFPYFRWTFAFLQNQSSPISSPNQPQSQITVKINDLVVPSSIVYPLCNGDAVSGKRLTEKLTWISFQAPQTTIGQIKSGDSVRVTVQMTNPTKIWNYVVKPVDCATILLNPPPTNFPTFNPTTPKPTKIPTPQPSGNPTNGPSQNPTHQPSGNPTDQIFTTQTFPQIPATSTFPQILATPTPNQISTTSNPTSDRILDTTPQSNWTTQLDGKIVIIENYIIENKIVAAMGFFMALFFVAFVIMTSLYVYKYVKYYRFIPKEATNKTKGFTSSLLSPYEGKNKGFGHEDDTYVQMIKSGRFETETDPSKDDYLLAKKLRHIRTECRHRHYHHQSDYHDADHD